MTTLKGDFTADEGVEVTWYGRNGETGSDWFYIAHNKNMSSALILVGTQFLWYHPDVFERLEPGFVTVQKEVKASQ